MKYLFSYKNPADHFIDIEVIIENINTDRLQVQLPAWRPGRYELSNFAKNIQQWEAFDAKGNTLTHHKITKDCWEIATKEINQVHIKYNYYAAELNAGSTFLDEQQLYVNPVNCCIYVPDRMDEACALELKVPKDYKVATSLSSTSDHSFAAKNFDELADSPFIASNSLKHNVFVLDGIEFNIWFQGECDPQWPKIIGDFFIFINEHFVTMQEFTVDRYHFLYQVTTDRIHHGVEHLASTVIALGPSYSLMEKEMYNEFLGVSSHELFHSWNIKSIRPIEMAPYDFTKENYSRLGYVCEGVTTYYGEHLLFRAGIYTPEEYMKSLSKVAQRHFDNYGRLNLSVADSSFDTWLDGYSAGIPNRKTSIYTEGSLIALMTHILIMQHTNNEQSLDNVMSYLYQEFAKKGKGYSESDYKATIEKIAGASFDELFNNYVWGTRPFTKQLELCLNYVGLKLVKHPSHKYYERNWGFKTLENHAGFKVTAVAPESTATKAGLAVGDEIIAINDIALDNNLAEWSKYFNKKKVTLTVNKSGVLTNIQLVADEIEDGYYPQYSVETVDEPSKEQQDAFMKWTRRKLR